MPEIIALIKINPLQSLGVFLLIATASYAWGKIFLPRESIFVKIPAGMIFLALLQRLLLPFTASAAPRAVPLFIALSALPGIYWLWKNENRRKLLFFGLFFLIFSLPAFLPPHGWDEQVYQTGFLVNIAKSGNPGSIAANPYAAYGLLEHFLLAGSAIYGGTALLRLLSIFCVIYLTGAVYTKLERHSKISAVIFAGLFFTGNLSLHFAQIFFAESFIAMLFTAGLFAIFNFDRPFRSRAIVAGLFAGGVVAVKLTGVAPALTLFILLWAEKSRKSDEVIHHAALFTATAIIIIFAFYIRNYLECGDFFYPFVNGVLGKDPTTVEISRRMTALGSERYGLGTLYGTIFGWLFAGYYGKIYDGFILGWAWIFFLAVIISRFAIVIFRNKKLSRRELFIIAGFTAGYLFWALTSQQSRFLYYLNAPAAIAAGIYLSAGTNKLVAAVRIICAAFLAFSSFLAINYLYVALRYLPESRKDPALFAMFVSQDPAYAASVSKLNALAGDKPVARLFESRSLYLAVPSIDITPGFNRLLTPLPENADEFYEKICGFSAILYVPGYRQMDNALSDIQTREKVEFFLLENLKNGRLTVQLPTGSDDMIFLPVEAPVSGGTDSEISSFSN